MTVAEARKWSVYQQAVYDYIETQTGSAIVEAVAGSGKTTTLVESCHRIDAVEDGVAIAFNKRIADTLAERLPNEVSALTLNALGHRAWARHTGKRVNVDKRKTIDLVYAYEDRDAERRQGLRRLVDLAKMAGIVPSEHVKGPRGLAADTNEVWESLISEYGITFGKSDEGRWDNGDVAPYESEIEIARLVLAKSIQLGAESIDFNDQLYLPTVLGVPFTQYDNVFVDEAQDVNAIQLTMIERSVARGGRVFAFGDPSQSIYHFRGAGADAMPALKEKFAAASLPLSISYRCSRAVVAYAKRLVPQIETWEGAVEGSVDERERWTHMEFRPTDAILCRNNAPLVALAFHLLRQRVACKVVGRDIGAGLISLVRQMRALNLDDLRDKLFAHRNKQAKNLTEDALANLDDRIASVIVFTENVNSIPQLIAEIEEIFADDAEGMLTLSTIHKAKGCEWRRVYLLDRRLLGARAKTPTAHQQERNLHYVAATRAMEDLVLIDSKEMLRQ